jgi:hypothetical protein
MPAPGPRVRTLTGAYLTVSVLTVAAVVLLRHHPSLVTDAVWVRTTIVAASALLLTVFAVRAAGGSARAYLRLRIVSAIVLVATAVVVAVPARSRPGSGSSRRCAACSCSAWSRSRTAGRPARQCGRADAATTGNNGRGCRTAAVMVADAPPGARPGVTSFAEKPDPRRF